MWVGENDAYLHKSDGLLAEANQVRREQMRGYPQGKGKKSPVSIMLM